MKNTNYDGNSLKEIHQNYLEAKNINTLFLDDNKYNIHVILSTFCPMGCKGCYQTELSQKKILDKDIAWKRIKETILFINNIPTDEIDKRKINLSFFGGEPLLQISTIIYILSKLRTEMNEDYMKVTSISIPTSGLANNLEHNLLLDNIDKIAILIKDLNLDCNISISHDGINNKELRNIPPEKVTKLIHLLQDKSKEHNLNLIGNRISTVIPQNFNEDYFVDNYKYIVNNTGLQPTFTLPYILDATSTFATEPTIFKKAIFKFLVEHNTKVKDWIVGKNSELPNLFENLLVKIFQINYNWCGAGGNHFTIKTDGSFTNCEVIETTTLDFANKIKEHCKDCEINNYCQRPCIKNFEPGNEKSLDIHCQTRIILFNEIRKILKN